MADLKGGSLLAAFGVETDALHRPRLPVARGCSGTSLHTGVVPATLDWLSGFPEAWSQLIYVLAGQYEKAGILGEIVIQADQASVAQELGGNPSRALAAPKQSLQRQLADGLRHVVRDKFKLNQPDGPSDGWFAEDALWLVSKPIADQLRAYLLAQGIEGVPSSNAPFFNMLQDQGVIQTNAQGKAVWKVGIDNGMGWKHSFTVLKVSPALIWNDPKDRPPTYSGSLTVETGHAGENIEQGIQASAIPLTPEASPFNVSGIPPLPEPLQPKAADDPAELAALLSLLDSVTNGPQPQSSESASPIAAISPLPDSIPVAKSEVEMGSQVIDDAPTTGPDQVIDLGAGFVEWLRTGLASHRIIINDTKALVHTVAGTAMLVTPGIFKRFVQEFPAIEAQAKARKINAWQLVQRAFEKQKLHQKTEKSLNIWTCKVAGPKSSKQLKGYLLKDPLSVFVEVPFDNPSLSVESGSKGEDA